MSTFDFKQKFVVMAGPCMFESKELGTECADFLSKECEKHGFQYVFKSSYDKANRTSQKGVRGPGLEKGLTWLSEIKKTFHIPVLTDVHNPTQALEAGEVVDVVQIPAFLSMWRPLLSAAASTNKWVQIKKGQHSHCSETIFAAQYVKDCGNKNAILCERGASYGYNDLVVDFRNLETWQKETFPIVFDATHAAQLPGAGSGSSSGRREVVPGLARAAVAFGVNGLFLEVHPNPAIALSDASTQLDFSTAKVVLEQVFNLLKAAQM